ncbi:MAG: Transcription antitermination protein NusB [Patescibacteria group bacterium]|nr:Transcription antitermination protein NusB [Patescibacteria group bacterium]
MANRHLSRSVAMQALFEWDFNTVSTGKVANLVNRVITDFAPGLDNPVFAHELVQGVAEKQDKLDAIIEKAAPEWPLAHIAIVDRNVLRLGLYELLFGDKKEVPARVAINEAIELAKTFGGENSGRFVNGVLGAVYKEMGEPGKFDVPAKKKRPKDVPYEEMPIENLGGAVVFCRHDGEIYLAMVHDIFGYWTLSKGHIEDNLSVEEGTAKEILAEMSVSVTMKDGLGKNEYIASDPEKGKIRKQVNYFLGECADTEFAKLKLAADKGGLDDIRWFKLADIVDLKMYDDIVPFVTKAIKLVMDSR